MIQLYVFVYEAEVSILAMMGRKMVFHLPFEKSEKFLYLLNKLCHVMKASITIHPKHVYIMLEDRRIG